MNIELHIDRLVFDGTDVAPGQGHLVRESVRSELVRLLKTGGLAGQALQGGAVAQVRAASVDLTAGESPDALGRQVAGAIYGGLGS